VIVAGYGASEIVWVIPADADPPEPPQYAADDFTPMCEQWGSWMDAVGAVRLGNLLNIIDIELAARLDTPATILAIAPVQVERTPLGDATRMTCTLGGGSNAAYRSQFDLDDEAPVLEIEEFDTDAPPVKVPPGSFEIGPGLFESMYLYPEGTDGYLYQFTLQFELVIDGQRYVEIVDNDGEPFEFAFLSGGPEIRPGGLIEDEG
jgi:hypothetical protein